MNIRKIKIIKQLLLNKSKSNHLTNYFITAAAFNKKGQLIGIENNKLNNSTNYSKHGCGIHAERELIRKYKNNIKTIILYRRGGNFNTLPIHPCPICSKLINKLNIKLILIHKYF